MEAAPLPSAAVPIAAGAGVAAAAERTTAMPVVRPGSEPSSNGGRGSSRRKVRAQSGVIPFWMRLLVWLIAVPLGFVIVFGVARGLGFLTQTQLEDVFLESGWDRFWPVARLLPFVALVTAAIVHFAILFGSRWRVRHSMAPLQPHATPPGRARSRKSQTRGSSDAQTPSA